MAGQARPALYERGSVVTDDEVALSKTAGQKFEYVGETGQSLIMQLVKNVSGGALLPRTCVKYDLDAMGTHVDGAATATARPAGIVDQDLPAAGVANLKWFLIAVEGIHDCLAGSSFLVGEDLVSVAAGEVDNGSHTFFYIGRAVEAAAAQADAKQVLLKLIG